MCLLFGSVVSFHIFTIASRSLCKWIYVCCLCCTHIYRTAKAHTYIHMHASIKKRSYVGRLGRKSFHIFQLSVEWIFVFCRCVPLCIVDVRVRSAFTRFPTYRLGLFFRSTWCVSQSKWGKKVNRFSSFLLLSLLFRTLDFSHTAINWVALSNTEKPENPTNVYKWQWHGNSYSRYTPHREPHVMHRHTCVICTAYFAFTASTFSLWLAFTHTLFPTTDHANVCVSVYITA